MTSDLRFVLIFCASCLAGVFAHEMGHVVAAWVQGVPAVPTPAKEYILWDEIGWSQVIWIDLGGVVATALVVVGVLTWYVTERNSEADPVVAGALVPPGIYTVRFLILGRGHDGLEWQGAQTALGLASDGHAVDILMLVLSLIGITAMIFRSRASLRISSLPKIAGLVLLGFVLLVVLQVTNNALFDAYFPNTKTIDVPAGLVPG